MTFTASRVRPEKTTSCEGKLPVQHAPGVDRGNGHGNQRRVPEVQAEHQPDQEDPGHLGPEVIGRAVQAGPHGDRGADEPDPEGRQRQQHLVGAVGALLVGHHEGRHQGGQQHAQHERRGLPGQVVVHHREDQRHEDGGGADHQDRAGLGIIGLRVDAPELALDEPAEAQPEHAGTPLRHQRVQMLCHVQTQSVSRAPKPAQARIAGVR